MSRTKRIAAMTGAMAAACASTAAAAPAAPLAPFVGRYNAEWHSLAVGTSELELKRVGDGDSYVYTWTITARGVFRMLYSSDLVQTSWVEVVDDHARPSRYRAAQGDTAVSIDFDWHEHRARGLSEGKPIDFPLDDGLQDLMSIQLEVMLDLKHGALPPSLRIIDKDQPKDFLYALEGRARLHTAMGELDTMVVSSHRPNNDRVLRMWFAPALGFAPVQAERYRGDKLEFALRLKTLSR